MQPAEAPEEFTVAAWNIERCKRVPESARLLEQVGADVVLATEVDWGMARSGQVHTTRALAQALGMGYAFGVEFVELGTGDPYETRHFAGQSNEAGLHGNAILSRYPLEQVSLIPLDGGGDWYVRAPQGDDQLRVGGRMAMAAKITTVAGPLLCVSVHFESESTPESRGEQARVLLDQLDTRYGPLPCIIGGDLNTAGLIGVHRDEVRQQPQRHEPAFDVFAQAGFGWQEANTGLHTKRTAPGREARYPLPRLDWLLVRGRDCSEPRDWAALSEEAEYLSDHEVVSVRLR